MALPPTSDPGAHAYRRRYAAWFRSLPWPIATLFLVGVLFSFFMFFEVVWPEAGGVEWVENLLTAVALVLGMQAGEEIAARRYGPAALYAKDPVHWRALGLFALTTLVVGLVLLQIAQLFL